MRLTILSYALAGVATPENHAYLPPVVDGYADTKSIKNRELDLEVNGSDLALQVGEPGVHSGDIESRQFPEILMLVIVASLVVTGIIVGLVADIADDDPVSINLKLLASLVSTICHSVVRPSLNRWSPACTIITPHTTMLYATQHSISGSMGPRARIGVICTRSFRYPWEGR